MLKKSLDDFKWVTVPKEIESAYLLSSFELKEKKNTTITICGLGFFYLYINGQLVSKEINNPSFSDYDKRYYYRRYNITKYLKEGTNYIGIILGNGWFRETKKLIEFTHTYSDILKCGFYILSNNEVISSSDDDIFYKKSHVVFNNIYYGETHDYSLFDKDWNIRLDNSYSLCKKCDSPKGVPTLQYLKCEEEIRDIKPVEFKRDGNVIYYDNKENIVGYAVIKPTSDYVKVIYAEELYEDGSFDLTHTSNLEDQIQNNVYLNCKNQKELKPIFTINGFRYFSVEGGVCEVVKVVHPRLKTIASFKCHNDVINWEYEAYVRTMLNNMNYSIPTDCPTRERQGYLGDGQLTVESAMLTFDSQKFYKKWIQDILDSQDIKTGFVPYTAPNYGGGGGIGNWSSAITKVPYIYHKIYNDKSILNKCFSHMDKWFNYVDTLLEDGLVTKHKEGLWNVGEWITPYPNKTDTTLFNSYGIAKALEMMIEIIDILGKEHKKNKYQKRLDNLLAAIKKKYVKDGMPLLKEQGQDVLLFDLGLLNHSYLDVLVDFYKEKQHFDTGIIGTDVLLKVLFENKKYDVAYTLLTSTTYPSFGYEMEHNATTLWEGWTGECSMDHPMWGSYIKYFYYYFLGISFKDDVLTLNPKLCKDMLPIKAKVIHEKDKYQIHYSLKENKVLVKVIKNKTDIKESIIPLEF